MVTLHTSGSFKKSYKFLNKIENIFNMNILDKYGKLGVDALRDATPKDTGLTSESWYYKTYIDPDMNFGSITWYNTNVNRKNKDHTNIAILLQYDHATGTGGFVSGVDYINPALKPIFEEMVDKIWKEVKRA